MTSNRTKRIAALLGVLVAVVILGILYFAYQLSRDVDFNWEQPNFVEANEARRKLKRYDNALAKSQQGWVRFSQLEINSYLMAATTNAPAEESKYRLHRVGVELTSTNAILYSWGERRTLGMPLKFVVQRAFRVKQSGTNIWDLPVESVKVGDLEIPPRFWPRLRPAMTALDRPLANYLGWATNIQGMLVAKNEISQRPELRLFTYRPSSDSDLR